MGPRAGLDRCGKSRPPPGFDPRTVQPVASRYIDYATLPTANIRIIYFVFCSVCWSPVQKYVAMPTSCNDLYIETSGFRCSSYEAFALLDSDATKVDNCLRTLRDGQLVPSSRTLNDGTERLSCKVDLQL